ncbi:hypothetical protein CCP4SC76_1910001 [Gammaproteobacteria bacterium]
MFNDYQVIKTSGTGDNLKRLAENPSAVALAQMDVANDLIGKTPGWSDKMVVVRSDLGHECLFAVTSNPKLTSWGQVQQFATRVRVATAPKESGSYLTLLNLQVQDPALKGLDANLQNASDTLSAIKLDHKSENRPPFPNPCRYLWPEPLSCPVPIEGTLVFSLRYLLIQLGCRVETFPSWGSHQHTGYLRQVPSAALSKCFPSSQPFSQGKKG